MEKLLIIDGNSILNRAFYGIRPLSASDGTPTNAVYGFLNILFKYLEEETPDYICVAFDVRAKTFRHMQYEQYKAHRRPTPEDLIAQMPVIKEVLRCMNVATLEKEGYEADDIIGTVAKVCEQSGISCSILTGDKDDLQLASEKVYIKLVITKDGRTDTTTFDAAKVEEVYGVTPDEFIDVKGLMGDPSDNIPGVAGIGEKTALSLIARYHSIEEIYENLEQIEATPSTKAKLETGRDSAFLSKQLATIDCSVPIDINLDGYRMREYNNDELFPLFRRLNFKSFLAKLTGTEEVGANSVRPPTSAFAFAGVKAEEAGTDEQISMGF